MYRLSTAGLVLVLAIGATFLVERKLLYLGKPYPQGNWDISALESQNGVKVADQFFDASDGTRLHGWWVTPIEEAAQIPSILFFHGTAGNISTRHGVISAMVKIPARVFIVDYRGYGRSEGTPAEEGLYLDATASWNHLTEELEVSEEQIVLYGRSLGGAVAVELATRVSPAAIIIDSTFTSLPDVAAHHFPYYPKALIHSSFDSADRIREIAVPKLVMHSRTDRITPFEHGRRLFEAASEPKQFFEVVSEGHDATWTTNRDSTLEVVRPFIAAAVVAREPVTPE